MSKLSKFKIGDHVRVTQNMHAAFDKVGVVTGHRRPSTWLVHDQPEVTVKFPKWDGTPLPTQERHLTLADPDVHTVLDQMDAESADPASAPSHYRSHPSGIETIQITRHESFLRGNILKYVLRAPYKGSEIEDLKKAAQYLQWEIDRAEAAQ